MMNRYVLCSESSGMVQCALLRGVFSPMMISTSSSSKCLQNGPDLVLDPGSPGPLRQHNRAQRDIRLRQVPIDQNIVVRVVVPDLIGRVPQPPGNHVIPVFAARTQPLFQNLTRGGQDKDGNGFGNL